MSHNKRDYAAQLRSLGYRVTPQRVMILDTLCRMNTHATVSELYDEVVKDAPAIDRATVYRTINLFEELGLIVSAEIGRHTVYEVADEKPHHHLVCVKCGSVQTLDHHHFGPLIVHLSQDHNFVPHLEHMTISGFCADCQPQPQPSNGV